MPDFIPFNDAPLHYRQWGGGPELLIAFHGYGESGAQFELFGQTLGQQFTIIAVDLPLHGRSEWPAGKPFGSDEIYTLIDHILETFKQDRFSLMGYSLGGKICLAVLSRFPGQVDRIILFAPDGIRQNVWYNLAVYPSIGVKYFRHIIDRPQLFFRIIDLLRKFRVISASLHKFTRWQMETREKRQKVYDVWMTIKPIHIDLRAIRSILRQYRLPAHLFFGRYDKIIPPAIGDAFPPDLARVHILDKGHQLIDEATPSLILSLLKPDHD